MRFDEVLLRVATRGRDREAIEFLAGELGRLEQRVSEARRREIAAAAGGRTLAQLAGDLARAVDDREVEAASRRLREERERARRAQLMRFFDEGAPVTNMAGNLPHWRQEGVTYFVTFRLSGAQ